MKLRDVATCAAWTYMICGPLGLGLAYIATYLAYLAGWSGHEQMRLYFWVLVAMPVVSWVIGLCYAWLRAGNKDK